MKNIHLLPTDKPSRFSLNSSGKYHLTNQLHTNSPNFTNQHIYITNNEEIKDGDYCIITDIESVLYGQFEKHRGAHQRNDQWKKIILTTDQSLDGVQAIDDEFLEWYVHNPNCEKVEVHELRFFNPDTNESEHCKWELYIPKEESKQETHICKYCKVETTQSDDECYMKPQQETLEEVAEEFYSEQSKAYEDEIEPMFDTSRYLVAGFIEGAEWQQERMYSEEDMKQFAFECVANFLSNDNNKVEIKLVEVVIDRVNIKFEQFKKK